MTSEARKPPTELTLTIVPPSPCSSMASRHRTPEEEGGLEVGVHDHVPLPLLDGVDGAEVGVGTGVVDEHVDAAQLRLGALDEVLQVLHAPHVGLDADGAAAERLHGLDGLLEGAGLAGGDGDVGAGLGQAQRDRAADAAAAAGDDGDFALQREICDDHGGLLGTEYGVGFRDRS